MSKTKKEDFGRFSTSLLKKKYGDNYKIITQKDYKDLTNPQKKLYDQTVKNFKDNPKTNKLIIVGEKNKPGMFPIKPRRKFINLKEIDYRSSKTKKINELSLRGEPRRKGKELQSLRERIQGNIDAKVQKGKIDASYSRSEEGINPKTGTPIAKSNPRNRIIKELKRMSTTKDFGKKINKKARKALMKFKKQIKARSK